MFAGFAGSVNCNWCSLINAISFTFCCNCCWYIFHNRWIVSSYSANDLSNWFGDLPGPVSDCNELCDIEYLILRVRFIQNRNEKGYNSLRK